MYLHIKLVDLSSCTAKIKGFISLHVTSYTQGFSIQVWI